MNERGLKRSIEVSDFNPVLLIARHVDLALKCALILALSGLL